jgi:GNAT superfamily N-acetyltransferase
LGQTASDLELMETQVQALFTHDGNGRLRHINEPAGAPAPRFFMGRTRDGNLWRFRHDLPDDVAGRLNDLCASEPIRPRFDEPPVHLDSYKRILQSHGEIRREWVGPAYRFPEHFRRPTHTRLTGIVRITQANSELLRWGFGDWIPGLGSSQPCMAVVEDGRAVSLCCSVRISPQAHEAGVETLPDYRRRGYAARVVAGWAAAVRQLGCTPLYSTSWDNAASRGVAAMLGLILYGVDLHFT